MRKPLCKHSKAVSALSFQGSARPLFLLRWGIFDVEKIVHKLCNVYKNKNPFLNVSTNGQNSFCGKLYLHIFCKI